MKKLLFVIIIFSVTDILGQDILELSGIISKLDGCLITLNSEDSTFTQQKTLIKNGKFNFCVAMNQNYGFSSLVLVKPDKTKQTWYFFVAPQKMKIIISNSSNQYKANYENVPYQKEKENYDSLKLEYQDKLNKVYMQIREKINLKENPDSLRKVLKDISNSSLLAKINFIKKDSASYLNFYYYKNDIVNNISGITSLSVDSLYKLLGGFSKKLQNSKTGLAIKTELDIRNDLSIGKKMPMFVFLDSGFNKYSLRELLNKKNILLCFWSRGCKPCIESLPLLKSLYSEFNNNLEIVSILLEDNDKEFKNALLKYQLPWINTCNISNYVYGLDLESLYGIKYIPQYFLIDKSGTLVYQNVQSKDTDDYKELRNKLKKMQE